MKAHYNEPIVIETATESLTAEGRVLVWKSLQPVMGSIRHRSIRSSPDNSSVIELARSWEIAFRDNVIGTAKLGLYRLKWGDMYLYPQTDFRYNGSEYVAMFTHEENISG